MKKILLFVLALMASGCEGTLSDEVLTYSDFIQWILALLFVGGFYFWAYAQDVKGDLHNLSYQTKTLMKELHRNQEVRDGPYERLYGSGRLRGKGTYKDGKLHGVVVTFDTLGSEREYRTYKDGELHGHYCRFNSEGNPAEDGHYNKGVRCGVWGDHD